MKSVFTVALVANTGIGNEVLKALLKVKNIKIDSLCTRRLEGDFPYFDEEELEDYAKRKEITCFTNVSASKEYYEYLKERNIDLIIVASFHQILKKNLIDLPKLGVINLHPSLLPKYRGPNPLNWVLLNSESKTGVTAHYLTEKIDAGNILKQKEIIISDHETLGTLFKKSAICSGELIPDLIDSFIKRGGENGMPQDESQATYLKKPSNYEKEIKTSYPFEKAYKIIRAFHPFPGSIINIMEEQLIVKDFSLFYKNNNFKKISFSNRDIFLNTRNEN